MGTFITIILLGRKRGEKLPRPLRRYGNSKVYHVIFKGIDNQDIFYDDPDRKIFLKHISITKELFNYNLYAYCLMINHVHLVIKCQDAFLSKCIQSLLIRYAHYFNKKYKRTGPLFQNRFKSKNVENPIYFIDLCRYVHRNPEKAGVAKTQDYQWSSYKEYIEKADLVDTNILLHYFNNDVNEFIKDTTKIIHNENLEDYFEYELIERLNDEQLAHIIMQKFKIKDIRNIAIFFKLKNKDDLVKDLEVIKNINGTNIAQVARTIRVNRKLLEKVWNNQSK